MSRKFFSPTRFYRATRGHRGSLILSGFAVAGMGKADFVPDISKANNVGEAVLIAIADGFLGLLLLGLSAAIAATAWQFAARRDNSLDPDVSG